MKTAPSSLTGRIPTKREAMTQALHFTLLASYWAIGFMLVGTYLRDELFAMKGFTPDWRWANLLLASVVLVWIDTAIYHRACISKGRPLDTQTLFIFPIFNGVGETAIFLSVFKFGEQIVSQAAKATGERLRPAFFGGYVPYFTYITLIHVFMWLRILPDHLNNAPEVQLYRRILVPSKSLLATSWALLYFLYRDAWSVIVLHTLVDFGLVFSIHYSLWD